MFAHRLVELIGPACVVWTEAPDPEVGDGVIVEVVAAGVSFADLLQTQGRYQLTFPLPLTPGMNAAGVVRSAPPDAGVEAGQRVAVLRSHGCWQEVLAADPGQVLPLPDDMSFDAGAAAPLNYLTGLFALVRRGRARTGETLLVHGGAGGVGVAAIQLGRALGLRTIAVTSDGGKRDFALRCGAHHAVLSDGWLDAVRGLVGERAVDLVFSRGRPGDCVSPRTVETSPIGRGRYQRHTGSLIRTSRKARCGWCGRPASRSRRSPGNWEFMTGRWATGSTLTCGAGSAGMAR